jgi:hypothetical protein
MASDCKVKALVQVTVEVEVGTWGPGSPLEQVEKQAAESAVSQVRSNIADVTSLRIVGATKVTAMWGGFEK